MREHCSVLLTEAKTPMSSPVRKKKRGQRRGGVKIIKRLIKIQGEMILNHCSGLCSCFFTCFLFW